MLFLDILLRCNGIIGNGCAKPYELVNKTTGGCELIFHRLRILTT